MFKKVIFSIALSFIFILPVQAEKSHEEYQVKENYPNIDVFGIEHFKKFKKDYTIPETEGLKELYKLHQKHPNLTKDQLRDNYKVNVLRRNDRKGSLKTALDFPKRDTRYHKTVKKERDVNHKKN